MCIPQDNPARVGWQLLSGLECRGDAWALWVYVGVCVSVCMGVCVCVSVWVCVCVCVCMGWACSESDHLVSCEHAGLVPEKQLLPPEAGQSRLALAESHFQTRK